VGVDGHGVPCGTLLEAAKAKKMKTGLVVTSRITHATPASFSSHSTNRNWEEFIAVQQINNSVDVMFGGGLSIYQSTPNSIYPNLILYAEAVGYQVITTLADLLTASTLPLVGLFAAEHMPFEIDRPPDTPSLAQMTSTAISLLSSSSGDSGFFLMVEGSRIDMAEHNNDAAALYNEILAFNETIQTILDFAQQDGHTLVVITADHETGGLTFGRNFINGSVGCNGTCGSENGYLSGGVSSNLPDYAWYPQVLLSVNASVEVMADSIIGLATNLSIDNNNSVAANIQTAASEILLLNANINLAADENGYLCNSFAAGNRSSLLVAVGNVIANRALVGYSTRGHTGVDVNLWVYGDPVGSLTGNMDNTQVGKAVQDILQLDLNQITQQLSNFQPYPSNTTSMSMRRNEGNAHN